MIQLKQIRHNSDLSELMGLQKFCTITLTEYETNGFCWPKGLMDARNLTEIRHELERLEAKEAYSLKELERGYVPQEIWWILDEKGRFIGAVKLRYVLTPKMWRYGGHIGLGLAEGSRGKGYGTEALKMALEKCREHGLYDVLLTVREDNFASRRMVEKCGGKLLDKIDRDGVSIVRYLIKLD